MCIVTEKKMEHRFQEDRESRGLRWGDVGLHGEEEGEEAQGG